jgi:hypothetical protein
LGLATLGLLAVAWLQHFDIVSSIDATNRLARATESAATDRRQTTSADVILKIDAMLEDHRYDRISDDIQSYDSNYHLPKYKNRADADAEEYIGIFEDLGSFIDDNLINPKMAYEHFFLRHRKSMVQHRCSGRHTKGPRDRQKQDRLNKSDVWEL